MQSLTQHGGRRGGFGRRDLTPEYSARKCSHAQAKSQHLLVLYLQVISRMADHVPPSEVVRHIIGTYGGQDFGGFRWVPVLHPAHRTYQFRASALLDVPLGSHPPRHPDVRRPL